MLGFFQSLLVFRFVPSGSLDVMAAQVAVPRSEANLAIVGSIATAEPANAMGAHTHPHPDPPPRAVRASALLSLERQQHESVHSQCSVHERLGEIVIRHARGTLQFSTLLLSIITDTTFWRRSFSPRSEKPSFYVS
eukprot:4180318-Pleurochrysis_carterae.AAC.1